MTRTLKLLRRVLRGPASRRRILAGPAAVMALGVAAFAFMAVTGTAAQGANAPVSTNASDIAAGEQLFAAHCQSCHGVNGVGGTNGSPELIDAGAAAADFYITTGRMPLNATNNQALRHHSYFNATQTRDLVAYIADLPAINSAHPLPRVGEEAFNPTSPGIPTVAPLCTGPGTPSGCVTLSDGQRYYSLNCAQCHQAAGAGGMLSKGDIVPSLHNASLTQVAEAMRVGPSPMPVFGTGQLSAKQVSAIAQYVQYLHNPNNRGGLGISHFGPIAEGFVGIVIGFGVLMLASRLIGNRG